MDSGFDIFRVEADEFTARILNKVVATPICVLLFPSARASWAWLSLALWLPLCLGSAL
jgi:hypothetical protein